LKVKRQSSEKESILVMGQQKSAHASTPNAFLLSSIFKVSGLSEDTDYRDHQED